MRRPAGRHPLPRSAITGLARQRSRVAEGGSVFAKLLGVVVAAKSGALSGVLIVAGAVVTVTAGGGMTDRTFDEPSPTTVVEEPADESLLPDEDTEPDAEDED